MEEQSQSHRGCQALKRLGGVVVLVATVAFGWGCERNIEPESEGVLVEVPLTRQATDYTCGVACVQSVLAYHGMDKRQDDIATEMGVVEFAYPGIIIPYMQRQGFTVKELHNMLLITLKEKLAERIPVMVCIQAWAEPFEQKPIGFYTDRWDDGHWVLVVGFEGAELIFMDPATIGNYTTMSAEEFLTRWHDQYQLSGADQVRLVHYGLTFEGVAPDYDPSEFKELN